MYKCTYYAIQKLIQGKLTKLWRSTEEKPDDLAHDGLAAAAVAVVTHVEYTGFDGKE